MKKLFLSLIALATIAIAFTSCEDVPMPYSEPDVTPDTTTTITPSGSGTADDPYNVAMARQLILSGSYPTSTVYVKGIITSLASGNYTFSADYGNYSYCINDSRTTDNQFTIFRGKNLGNKNFTSADQLSLGDTVVVCGTFTSYNGSPQLDAGNYIYSINGKKADNTSDDNKALNTQATAWTVAEAVQHINDNGGNALSGEAYVKGIISSVDYYNETYKSITYYISDNGTDKTLQVYSGKGLDGADFNSKEDLTVGKTVIVLGTLKAYNGNPEFDKTSKIVSISDGGSTDTPAGNALDISGTTVTINNSSATAGTETASIDFSQQGLNNGDNATEFTLSDGTTITFDGNGERNAPKYYNATKGVRVYLNNIIRFAGIKKIAKIVMECDSYNGTDYVGNKGASVEFNGNNVVYTNSDASITSGGGTQLRVKTITITYAQ